MIRGPQPICRHPLDFTVTITSRKCPDGTESIDRKTNPFKVTDFYMYLNIIIKLKKNHGLIYFIAEI